jgi:hypothetical protein
MTKPPVSLAPAAGGIRTNPYRLQHMRYTDLISHEVIFFCKKIFKFSLFFIQKENPSFISVSWQMNYKHAWEFAAAFILHPTLSFTISVSLYISFFMYLFISRLSIVRGRKKTMQENRNKQTNRRRKVFQSFRRVSLQDKCALMFA